jgi:hypothetical protein
MTVSTTGSKSIGMGNGATVAWPFTFKVIDHSSVVVTYTNTAGVDTTLTLANYDITFNSNGIGGTVTYPRSASSAAPIPVGSYLTIQRVVALAQPTDVVNQGSFNPVVLENGLDNLELQIQQIAEAATRAIVFPPSNLSPTQLPGAAARANRLIGFDANGNLYLSLSDALSAAAAAASAAAALAAQLLAQAAAQLAVDLSNAQYTQVGTGAVADKFADFDKRLPFCEQFGGKGDGVQDDGPAMQRCLNALGVCLLSPIKTYAIGTTVTVADNQRLCGLGAKARLQTHSSVAPLSGFVMVKFAGGTTIRNLAIYATNCFYALWAYSGGQQSIEDVDCQGPYTHCLNVDGAELFTNADFTQAPPMTGWTLGGGAAYSAGHAALSAAGDYIRQQITGLRVGGYVHVSALLTGAAGTVVCDIGTTVGGTDILNGGVLSGVNWRGVAGQGLVWATATATTVYVTIRRTDALGGAVLISPVSAKESGVGTGMVWNGSGDVIFNNNATPGYSIGLNVIEPSVIGDRRFSNLNGVGTKMFDFQGANLTFLENCFMGGVTFDINFTTSYVTISGGRIAADINLYSHQAAIEGCQIGGKLTVKGNTAYVRIDGTNKIGGGVEFEGGVNNSWYIHNPDNGTFTNNSGVNNNLILGLRAADGSPLFTSSINVNGNSGGTTLTPAGSRLSGGAGFVGISISDTSGNAASRNFSLLDTYIAFGTLDLSVSSAAGGAPSNSLMRYGYDTSSWVQHMSTKLSFYGGTPIVKPTVTGSRGANAALGSLVTALANLGLITDTTS